VDILPVVEYDVGDTQATAPSDIARRKVIAYPKVFIV
jgi:hypothetical protein